MNAVVYQPVIHLFTLNLVRVRAGFCVSLCVLNRGYNDALHWLVRQHGLVVGERAGEEVLIVSIGNTH